MREYTDDILDEIRQELTQIFALHKVHRIDGKMRIYSVANQQHWMSHESGFEFWFGQDEIERAINKIQLFYRAGQSPNTAFLLDPVLYNTEGDAPVPVGSGVIWCTVLANEGEKIPEEGVKRVKDIGLFAGYLRRGDNERAGLKMLGLLRKPSPPVNKEVLQDGSIVQGIQALADLVNVNSNARYIKQYLLSGLQYRTVDAEYQHPKFMEMFGDTRLVTPNEMRQYFIFQQKIIDAGVCWNAYDRDPELYARYGIDVSNLKRNLKTKLDIDTGIDKLSKEINMIWSAHKAHGLQGEMRLYTAPVQDRMRSKSPGFEFWFGPDDVPAAIEQLKLSYNGGILPNSPLLLDPIVYKKDENGARIPVGTSVAWTTSLMVGNSTLDMKSLDRIRDAGGLAAPITRGSTPNSGVKAVYFLEEPYLFDEAAIKKLLNEDVELTEEEKIQDDISHKIDSLKEEGGSVNSDDPFAEVEDNEESDTFDAIPVPGCEELAALANVNNAHYMPYYVLSGLEYITAHGAYSLDSIDSLLGEVQVSGEDDIKQLYKPIRRLKDAQECWDAYDRTQSLWDRFGVNREGLDTNLKYFNLCARDFDLLDATGGDRKNQDETFDFLVPGWIPLGAVTLIGATGGTGKSSAAHRLVTMCSIDWKEEEEKPLWLGKPINWEHTTGLCIHFSGEDGAPIMNARMDLFDPDKRSKRFMMQRTEFGVDEHGKERNLAEFLADLHKLPDVSAVVIDPARKYLEGDEEDSEVVSNFFEAIEEFAIEKHCAMIVVHHLVRRAYPKDTREVLDCLRGSQVFIDRPRVVIGMYREGPYVVCGLAKNNIPPSLGMVDGEFVFARDPEHLDLVLLPGDKGHRSFTVSEDELEQIKLEQEAQEQLDKTLKDKEGNSEEEQNAVSEE